MEDMQDIFLKPKEAKRMHVLQQLTHRKLTTPEAAQYLGLSQRQVLRLKANLQAQGIAALAHKSRGKPSAQATPKQSKELLLGLARHDWNGASYAHMAELLQQRHQITLCPKTIGRILQAAGLAHEHTHKPPRRHKSRPRRSCAGALVQCDASFHDWLEGRSPALALHGLIDDATSTVLGLHFAGQENTQGYLQVLEQMLNSYGVPQSLYSDRHTLFVSPKTGKLSLEEELAGTQVPLTQFGRALEGLRIQHLHARSAQAKGRIERLWGTLQERLVLEMRLAKLSTREQANAFLPDFLVGFNARFAVPAADSPPAWRAAPPQQHRDLLLCLQHERTASRGSSISFAGTLYQLLDTRGKLVALLPKARVVVLEQATGGLRALYKGTCYRLIPFKVSGAPGLAPPSRVASPPPESKRLACPPAVNHPWRGYARPRPLPLTQSESPSPG